jgi:hypothetical protein
MQPLLLEITKGVGDSSFSMDELFYRFFGKMPLLFFKAGSSDLYDRDEAARFADEWDDNELKNPHKGPEELEECVNKFFKFINDRNLQEVNKSNGQREVVIGKYSSFDANIFVAYIILLHHEFVVKLQVTPGKSETLTAVSILGLNEGNAWEILTSFGKEYVIPPIARKDVINIITQSNGEFYLKEIPLINSKRQEFSYDHYNEDFKDISETVLTSLQSDNDSGLYLFHGDPGTGKTTMLKYLLHTISKKKLIYLPPDLIEHLSAPNFVTFLMSQATNSILLIEDAENVLRHRESGGNQAVSNILNISDGILGDVLKLQFVCTFNSKLEEIDQALLRPGRLVASYRFEKLTKDRAIFLMEKIHGPDVKFEPKEMTLAEVFNFNKMPVRNDKKEKQKLGFT